MNQLSFYQLRIASASNISQNGFHALDVSVHSHDRFGSSDQVAISRAMIMVSSNESLYPVSGVIGCLPHDSSELLLIAGDIPTQLLFHAADRGDWVLERIVPGFQALRIRCLGSHTGGICRSVETILENK